MTSNDLSQVSALATQLGYTSSMTDITARFDSISNDPSYALFVAKSEMDVLGFIQVNMEPVSILIDARVDIAALIVKEECRGNGIGQKLLVHAENWAKGQGISIVRVRSNTKRSDAHRFYMREGYTISKVSNIFSKKIS
ncbi:MAG: hypothetical protein A2381_18715 [Bdellovibrionales bacterium RIFOXYB1_FULL_37_110]|nr:MAG: hypothetical protein A2417_18265 [Bdellovibrionales bacterium RIFOXYC1_FULL_37_79]OFZ58320.1 MAG: hypothetical protein A2381_18715 [Bdellovibrionales bacterium RIFOXYB1_FULL_37_110]OFZ63811.1 MAG: hypothetical protein A2577_12755 [Bdellovibrionales bacterium RIFOXYD1_FULL_36_51]